MIFNERIRGAGLMRTLVFLPVAIPQSVSAVIWAVAFRPDGPLNGVLVKLGIAPQGFLTSPDQALASIMLTAGEHFWFDIEEYERFFHKPIPARLTDLLRIAGV